MSTATARTTLAEILVGKAAEVRFIYTSLLHYNIYTIIHVYYYSALWTPSIC